MAKSVEDIIQLQLGGQALQIARLIAENEKLKEDLEAAKKPKEVEQP